MRGCAITIESKPGRAPKPVWSRWSCTCGAGRRSFTVHARTVREVDEHEASRPAEVQP